MSSGYMEVVVLRVTGIGLIDSRKDEFQSQIRIELVVVLIHIVGVEWKIEQMLYCRYRSPACSRAFSVGIECISCPSEKKN